MAANIDPIYTRTPNAGNFTGTSQGPLVTANTTKDLTSGTSYLIFTAGSDGAYVKALRIRPAGTNVATVVRVWINNGSTTGTASNNALFDEITVAATTNSEVAAIAGTEVPMNIPLPGGYRIYCTTGTTVTAIFVVAIGGDY